MIATYSETPVDDLTVGSPLLLVCSVLLIVWLVWRGMQRKRGFQAFARRRGFSYTYFGFKGGKRIYVFADRKDWTITAKHLVRGTIGDIEVSVTDAAVLESFAADSPRRTHHSDRLEHDLGSSRYTTVILLNAPDLDLPQFKVHARDKSEDFMIGDPGIRGFDDYAFESQKRTTGDDSERVVNTLTADVRTLLRKNRTLTVEGEGSVILIFHYLKVMPFRDIEQTIAYGIELAHAFAKA